MSRCFAYIRVSTTKQKEKGVSLQEQRDAITGFASRERLTISEWFEEHLTAAKQGRPAWKEMLRRLRRREADGLIVHKIDRSARNLRDWSDLGELIDTGVTVHFANEGLDLHTRGGRLSADIQAVVAADYVRNLREETRKGFRGRLKQGLYPLYAPLGYLDRGAGKVKEVDPERGPFMRRAFDLYSTARYSLRTLAETLYSEGLRNRTGSPVSINSLSKALNNSFYCGVIRIKTTGETYPGKHEPLITKRLFDRVQNVLHGRINTKAHRHEFTFRKLLTCGNCGRRLIGERQKGHVYYRCHTRECPTKGIREEAVESPLRVQLGRLEFTPQEQRDLENGLQAFRSRWGLYRERSDEGLRLQLAQVTGRLDRLTDLYVDGGLDEDAYRSRRESLLGEERELRDRLAGLDRNPDDILKDVRQNLELAHTALLTYDAAPVDERRYLVETFTSNRTVTGKDVAIDLDFPFCAVENRSSVSFCAQERYVPRSGLNLPSGQTGPMQSQYGRVFSLAQGAPRRTVRQSGRTQIPPVRELLTKENLASLPAWVPDILQAFLDWAKEKRRKRERGESSEIPRVSFQQQNPRF